MISETTGCYLLSDGEVPSVRTDDVEDRCILMEIIRLKRLIGIAIRFTGARDAPLEALDFVDDDIVERLAGHTSYAFPVSKNCSRISLRSSLSF